jgi:hypothetical protein
MKMSVIEGGDESDGAFAQHTALNTSPDMSPTPATVNGTAGNVHVHFAKWRLTGFRRRAR